MAKFKVGDIAERIVNTSEEYRVVDIKGYWYHLESLKTGALYRGVIVEMDRMFKLQQSLFNIGDKLRYKYPSIDLTFEVVALEDGKYVLKKSIKGEEVSADYSHVHELLELDK